MEAETAIAEAIRMLTAPAAALAGALDALSSLTDDDLCRRAGEIEHLGRLVDALRLQAAAEIDARSGRVADGSASPALGRRLGVVGGVQVLERVARISQTEAARRIRLGAHLHSRVSISGETLPASFPAVAAAIAAGEIGVDAATAIVRPLAHAAPRADPGQLADAERYLVDLARTDLPDLVAVQARTLQQALDTDGAEPREAELRRRRSFRIGREINGMTPFHGLADPVGAALLRAAIAERTTPHRTPRFVADDDPEVDRDHDGIPIRDDRTRDQRSYDVLLGLLTAGIRTDRDTVGSLHSVATVQVVVTADDLAHGTGLAWLDDVTEPITARTAAELACDGGVEATVVDAPGRPLHQGRRLRYFSAAQRKALAIRDGGCPIPQRTAPPSWTHAHHVTEWHHGGTTDIDNGVLLCPYHHHLIHQGHYRLRIVEGLPQLLAPPWIDPNQTWTPIGRPRWKTSRVTRPRAA
jgi:hypothetical protein